MKKIITLFLAIAGMVSTASADDYVKGSWDGWTNTTQFTYADGKGTLTLNLAASTDYTFKFIKGSTYYGNSGTMTSTNCVKWGFSTTGGDCTLTTTIAGDYTFIVTWNGDTPQISVLYPVANQYVVHFKKGDGWSYVNAHRWIYLNGNTLDLTSWPGIVLSENTNNPGYYDVTFSDSYNYVKFSDNGSDTNRSGDVAINFSYPETWVTDNATISTSAPSSWKGYTRSVTANRFGTICLPFAATVTGATVYKIVSTVGSGASMTGINLESVESLEAGKAYIFKADADATSITATYSGSYADATDANGMLGNLSATDTNAPQGNYVVSNNQIHKVTGDDVKVGQYRAYITLTGISPATSRGAIFMGLDDESTGIENIQAEQGNGNAIYNLQGQRVKAVHKGLVIVNGKKQLMK